MQADTLIHARWILPVEPAGAPLPQHSLAIQDGRITALLPSHEARAQCQADQVVELPQHILLPGLVNAHTHSPMSLLRGIADDLPLMPWLQDHIWPAEARWVSAQFVADGSRLAIAEMIRSGTTCFNDMYFFPDETARVAAQIGMRAVVGLILLDTPTIWAADAAGYLAQAQRVHAALQDEPLITTTIAPHAPYTVSDALLRDAQAHAALPTRMHIHVHETADEIQQSLTQHGIRPLQRLQQLGLLHDQMIAVHMTQLTAAEIAQLATTGTHVVHCPESNMKLAAGACPAQQLLTTGVNVALGTDGAASNNDLDMLGELHTAALFGKHIAQDAQALNAEQVIRMATINGAKALGLGDQIGSLQPGKAADLIAVDLGQLATQPVYHPESHLVYSATRDQVSDVWIAGQRQLANEQLTRLDTNTLQAQAEQWQARIAATES
ncbi:MAG: TRZ/ATZ family hydrolase [Pseudomonadota bacterium]